MVCKICNREFNNDKGLAQHVRHTHHLTAKDYYLKYIDTTAGICCSPGCDNPTPFNSIREGFQKHCCSSCANSDSEHIEKFKKTVSSFSDEKKQSIRDKTRITCNERYGGTGFASKELTEKAKETSQKKYGDRNFNNREKFEQTCLERYGDINNLISEEGVKKAKQTKIEKYGDENYNNSEKRRETNLMKYGNACPANSDSGHAKAVNTMIVNSGSVHQSYLDRVKKSKQTKKERYDDENYHNVEQLKITMRNKDFDESVSKRKKTCIEQYDVDSYSKTDEFIRKYEDTNMKKYGYKYPFAQGKFKQNYSKGEKEVVAFVKQIYQGVILEGDRTTLLPNENNGWKSNHELDIYLPGINLAIEYNGNYYHDYNKFPEKKAVDEQKVNECVQLGIELLTIWENDWKLKRDEMKQFIQQQIERKLYE